MPASAMKSINCGIQQQAHCLNATMSSSLLQFHAFTDLDPQKNTGNLWYPFGKGWKSNAISCSGNWLMSNMNETTSTLFAELFACAEMSWKFSRPPVTNIACALSFL